MNSISRSLAAKILPLIGIVIILLMTALFYWWEIKGKEAFLYEEVLIVTTDIPRGATITENHLMFNLVDESQIINGAIFNPDEVIGKVAKQFIPAKSQLTSQFFLDNSMLVDPSRINGKIPSEWIYALPNTLRRYDTVYFYLYKEPEPEQEPVHQNNFNLFEDFFGDANPEQIESDQEKESEIQVEDLDTLKEIQEEQNNPLVYKTMVSYVKDGSNREVVSLDTERMDGTSVIREVEIATTVEDLEMLSSYVEQGYRFILLYTEDDSDEIAVDHQ